LRGEEGDPAVTDVLFAATSELSTLTHTFLVGAAPTDPTTVTLGVTDPTGTTTTYTYAGATITKTGTGAYSKTVPCGLAGTWQYVWTATGTVVDTIAGTWFVEETTLGHLYCTPESLKNRFGITDTTDDYEIHAACWASSRSLENYCKRVFWTTSIAEARVFETPDPYHLELPEFCDVLSVITLKTDEDGDGIFETTWASTDFELGPRSAPYQPEPRPYTEILAVGTKRFPHPARQGMRAGLVQVLGPWGWSTTPYGIRQAALILAAETFKLKDAPLGIAGFGEFGAVRVRDNPMTRRFATPYIHRRFGIG
jgi:hypothetical protein